MMGGARGPFPLPLAPVRRRRVSLSSRGRSRASRSARVTELANAATGALNSLYSGRKTRLDLELDTEHAEMSAVQKRAASHIRASAARFAARGGFDPNCGRLPYLQGHANVATALSPGYHSSSPSLPIVADKASLPANLTATPLLGVLPPSVAEVYARPSPAILVESPAKLPPAAFNVASVSEYTALVTRLSGVSMVAFTLEPRCVNGVFATAKDEGRQRLIIDARRANAHFAEPPSVELPSPDLLARLEVPEDGLLHVAKDDADNLYHRFRLPDWMWPYFCLPRVRAGDVGVGDLFGDDTLVWPCCTTLPMGFSHSVYLAQTSHEHQISMVPGMGEDARITRGGDFRLDRPRFLVYIDDVVYVGLAGHVGAMRCMQDAYAAHMSGVASHTSRASVSARRLTAWFASAWRSTGVIALPASTRRRWPASVPIPTPPSGLVGARVST